MAKFTKNETVFTVYDSGREIEFEEVKERCEINDSVCPDEDSPEYYSECEDILEVERDDFWANLEACDALKVPCMLTGELGLWKGRPSIFPERFDCVEDAVKRCIGRDTIEFDLVYNKGVLELNCHHHDGTNCFYIRKLSKKGIEESDKGLYLSKDSFTPRYFWFCQFKPEEIF